jgi:DNA adenine methylase
MAANIVTSTGLTPFSREEFALAIETNGHGHDLSDLERARRFFIRARQVRTGLAQTASIGRWANCLKTSRAGMAGAVSRWLGSVEGLEWLVSRLLRVQIEHDDAFNVIKRYDDPETLFYCDPPYPHDSRGDSKAYQYEMTDEEHIQLYQLLSQVKGKVAISSYHWDLMDELYKNWYIHEEKSKKAHSIKTERVEVLWTNYPITTNGNKLVNQTQRGKGSKTQRINKLLGGLASWQLCVKSFLTLASPGCSLSDSPCNKL